MENLVSFTTDAKIKNVLGKDLIKDDITAINELVKNSIDAGADNIDILINEDEIIISDDGCGMSADDIKNKWMRLAYSSKTKEAGVAGSKGIGRFSCDRLGTKLDLYTRKSNSTDKDFNYLSIDWTKFEVNEPKDFSDVQFELTKKTKDDENYNTIIVIKNLRFNLNQKYLSNRRTESYYGDNKEKLQKSLQKLINPKVFNDDNRLNTKITLNGEVISNEIFNYLNESGTFIYSLITKDTICVSLYFRNNEIFSYTKDNPYEKLYDTEIQINYLTQAQKSQFHKKTGSNVQSYGSIFFFNNGFRVFPYGEPGDDYLKLDSRKTQGYNRFLGTRELIGYVSSINNPNVAESSSREGISDELFIEELRDCIIKDLLSSLEYYLRDLVSWDNIRLNSGNSREITWKEFNQISDESYAKFTNYISKKSGKEIVINKPNLEENIKEEQKNKSKTFDKLPDEIKKELEEKAKIKKEKEELEEKVEDLTKTFSHKSEFTKKIVNSSFHDITNYINNVNRNIRNLTKDLNKKKQHDKQKMTFIKNMQKNSLLISGVSKYGVEGILKSYGDVRECNIFELFEHIINGDKLLSKEDICINLDANLTYTVETSYFSAVSFLNNIIFNAKKFNAKNIYIRKTDKNIIEITDDGIGISSEVKDVNDLLKIGYSTTNGTGMGFLYIQEFVQKILKSDLTLTSSDNKLVITLELNNEFIA